MVEIQSYIHVERKAQQCQIGFFPTTNDVYRLSSMFINRAKLGILFQISISAFVQQGGVQGASQMRPLAVGARLWQKKQDVRRLGIQRYSWIGT